MIYWNLFLFGVDRTGIVSCTIAFDASYCLYLPTLVIILIDTSVLLSFKTKRHA